MSGIGGFFSTQPNGPEWNGELLLHRLGRGLDRIGPDGGDALTRGAAGMVWRAFATAPRQKRGRQPLAAPDGSLVACDGRIDNLEELRRAYGPGDGDPCAVLHAAWRALGDELPSRLLGDFALAIWDASRRRLLLARDPFGIRPLFHATADGVFVFASRVAAILDATGVPLDVDDDFIADYLAFPRLSASTPFRAIRAVAPGHSVIVSEDGVVSRRYWSLARAAEVRLGSDAEYEEAFRTLFFDSVRARLDVDGVACAELSGGLDSSSIVCVADRLIADGSCSATALETISYVFDESPAADERLFIGAVERSRGRRGIHLREEDHRILSSLPEETFLEFPTPIQLFGGRGDAVATAMQSAGARVLLRGTAGDQVLWGESNVAWEVGDLAVQRRWRELRERMKIWSLATRKPYVQLLWEAAVLPSLPLSLQVRFEDHETVPAWLDRGFVKRTSLAERMIAPSEEPAALPSSRAQQAMLERVSLMVSWGYFTERGTIDCAYPFLDRRVVEFCYGIPLQQKLRPFEMRSLLRRALGEILPPEIARRGDKKGPDEAIYRAVAREWPRLSEWMREPRVAAYGYASADGFRDMLRKARHGINVNTPALLRTLSLELWLRSVERKCARRSVGSAESSILMKGGELDALRSA